MDWSDVVARITGTPPAHIATAGADGTPHAATVMPGVEGANLWIAMRAGSGKAGNLAANPKVALMFEGHGAETYVWGTVELVTDEATKTRVWNGSILPYDMAGFFGTPTDTGWLLAKVTPTRAIVMAQDASGLGRHTWAAG